MISDAEQRRLAEIESALRRDDPAFVEQFNRRPLAPWKRCVWAILAVLVVSALAWVLGGALTAVIVLSVIGIIAVALGLWRWRAHPSRRSS